MQLTIDTLIDPQVIRVIRKVGRLVALEAGFGSVQASEVEVALSEALSNAFFHAYRGTPGPVHVEIAVEAGAVRLLVRDEGAGLRGRLTIPRSLAETDGRGLYLISQLMDEVELIRSPEGGRGTSIRMVKRPESPLPGPGGELHTFALTAHAGTPL